MEVTVNAYGSRLFIAGTEIDGFTRIGSVDGMTIIMKLDAGDTGQRALATASVSDEPCEFVLTLKDGAQRRFLAVVRSCEMEGDDLRAVLCVARGSIEKVAA